MIPDTWEYRYDLKGQLMIEKTKENFYLNKLMELNEKISIDEMIIVDKLLRGEDATQDRLELLSNKREQTKYIESFVIYFHLYERSRDMVYSIRQTMYY